MSIGGLGYLFPVLPNPSVGVVVLVSELLELPRIRTIKPEAFKDEDLWFLEVETGLPIFRSFVGLWCVADRAGRFEWRPLMLKAEILPYWEGDFSRVLDALTTRGFIVKYASNGREYGYVRTFLVHQVINNRERDSVLPDPSECEIISDTLTRAPRVNDACPTRLVHAQAERKGRERKGKEITGEIKSLEDRFSLESELVSETRSACSLSRKNGTMSDSVWLRVLKQLEPYPTQIVIEAMTTFTERYADGEKDERYLIGICRGLKKGKKPYQSKTRFDEPGETPYFPEGGLDGA